MDSVEHSRNVKEVSLLLLVFACSINTDSMVTSNSLSILSLVTVSTLRTTTGYKQYIVQKHYAYCI